MSVNTGTSEAFPYPIRLYIGNDGYLCAEVLRIPAKRVLKPEDRVLFQRVNNLKTINREGDLILVLEVATSRKFHKNGGCGSNYQYPCSSGKFYVPDAANNCRFEGTFAEGGQYAFEKQIEKFKPNSLHHFRKGWFLVRATFRVYDHNNDESHGIRTGIYSNTLKIYFPR